MTLRSLCSGYEGLGLAVEAVTGARLVDHAEIDPAAIKVHDTHWPGMPNLGDLTANCVEFTHHDETYTTLDWAALEPTDILCAGFPCQPLSQAGRRKVTNDARWLWPYIAHAVRVLRPRLVCLENVPPLLRPWRDDDGWWNPAPIEEIAGDLAALGYMGSWRCVRASDIGAPHRRERIFVVGVASNADAVLAGTGRDGREVPQEAESARWAGVDVHAAVDGRTTAADADVIERRWAGDTERRDGPATDVRRGAPQSGGRRGAPADSHGQRLTGRPEPRVEPFGSGLAAPRRDDTGRLGAGSRRAHGPAAADSTGGGRAHEQDGRDTARQPVGAVDRAGRRDHAGDPAEGVHELGRAAAELAWGPYGPAIRRWERLTRPAPAPTDDRGRLSPAFSEWMMGLPAGWVTDTGISRTAQLHVIGNGVVPAQAIAALTDLLPVGLRGAA